MFTKSAHLYDAVYCRLKDYPREAERLHELIQQSTPGARTLLDVACGTGLHLEHLSRHYEVAGIDRDPRMLELARRRLPEASLQEADMTTFDLGRRFDAVTCLFSSVGYLLTAQLLRDAVVAMSRHVEPGGVLIVEPWITPEDWDVSRGPEAIFVDDPDIKVARMSTARREADRSLLVFHYLVATATEIEYFSEQHATRLHSHRDYLSSFSAAGLRVEYEKEGLMGRGLYIGLKRRSN